MGVVMGHSTAGPWSYTKLQGDHMIIGGDGFRVANMVDGNKIRSGLEKTANALLTAAAPELLAALKRAREAVNAIVLSTHSVSFEADLRIIDAAIAKATGAS